MFLIYKKPRDWLFEEGGMFTVCLILITVIVPLAIGGRIMNSYSWSKITPGKYNCEMISKAQMSDKYMTEFNCSSLGTVVSWNKRLFERVEDENVLLIKVRNKDYKVTKIQEHYEREF